MKVPLDSSLITTHTLTHEVAVYANDVVTRRRSKLPRKRLGGGTRTSVKPYSKSSIRKFVFFFRNIEPLRCWLTLTYPVEFPHQAAVIRDHRKKICRWLTAHGISYVWVIEFQKRGAPHFHLVLNSQPDRDALVSYWGSLASPSKSSKADKCVYLAPARSWDLTVRYFTKFKPRQRSVPALIEGELGRWWGHTKDITADPILVLRSSDDDSQALDVARLARKLNERKNPKARRDNGRYSYTTRDTAAAALDYVARSTESGSKARGREAKPHGDD